MGMDGAKVYFETFGCQMNVLDSQLVHGQLRALGYRFVRDWKQADVVLYNTCSVRAQAENKVYSRIGQVGIHKRKCSHVVLGVLGCMAERDGVDMLRRYPQIDILCGPGELDKVPWLIENAVKTRLATDAGAQMTTGISPHRGRVALQGHAQRRATTPVASQDQLELLDLSRSFSPEDYRGWAYVRITRGCNKFCTYCVVPNTRGPEIHRSPDTIIQECKRLVDAGVVEITLLGQTVNHYHYDHGAAVAVGGVRQPQVGLSVRAKRPDPDRQRRTTTFADLLVMIHDRVPGLSRLRFVTNFPRDFGDDILQVMASHRLICRYLHLPVQSGSDRILKMMNRDYTVQQYRQLLDRARAYLPDVQVASDLICGFPTETQEDHEATCELLRHCRFKNCFIFKYSPRPGTTAIQRFADDVPDAVKRDRNNQLLAIQSRISTQVHHELVGQTVGVFVESISQKAAKAANAGGVTLGWQKPVTELSGRTDGDLIVVFEGDPSMIGSIVDVQILHSAPLTLFGRVIEQTTTVSRSSC